MNAWLLCFFVPCKMFTKVKHQRLFVVTILSYMRLCAYMGVREGDSMVGLTLHHMNTIMDCICAWSSAHLHGCMMQHMYWRIWEANPSLTATTALSTSICMHEYILIGRRQGMYAPYCMLMSFDLARQRSRCWVASYVPLNKNQIPFGRTYMYICKPAIKSYT
jgi:hypothetical protein